MFPKLIPYVAIIKSSQAAIQNIVFKSIYGFRINGENSIKFLCRDLCVKQTNVSLEKIKNRNINIIGNISERKIS